MASELEPEVPAIDRSLLECSAEETAGVSAGTRAGTSGSRRPTPGNSRAAELWLGAPAAPASRASAGEASDPAAFLSARYPQIAPGSALRTRHLHVLFLPGRSNGSSIIPPPTPKGSSIIRPSPRRPVKSPTRGSSPFRAGRGNRGGKDTSWCGE